MKITDFEFDYKGYGCYEVTYKSPKSGNQWSTITKDMPLIDATKNTDDPKKKDLETLKKICKS